MQLVHLRLIGHGGVPFSEQLGAMLEMQREGKIQHVGLSNVSPDELKAGLQMGGIATVENMYGYGQRTTLQTPYGVNQGGEEVLALCEAHGIPLIPYFSLANSLPKADNRMAELAQKYSVTEAQLNIAWLLHKSPWILPIPGTSQLAHLRDNLKAAAIQLSAEDIAYLE